MKNERLMNRLVFLAGSALMLLGSGATTAQTLTDGAAVKREFHVAKYENTRGKAYCEIFLVRKPTNPAEIDADVYNSTPFNDCPKDKVAALDLDAIKNESGAAKVIFNPRRMWMADSYTFFQAAEKKSFGGIDMEWLAVLRVPPQLSTGARTTPYQPATIARDSEKRYLKGKPVLELISPDGVNWIMQSTLDRALPLATFADLTEQLKLAQGWSFRIRTLQRDLVMRSKGLADIVQDPMLNVYEGCTRDVCREE